MTKDSKKRGISIKIPSRITNKRCHRKTLTLILTRFLLVKMDITIASAFDILEKTKGKCNIQILGKSQIYSDLKAPVFTQYKDTLKIFESNVNSFQIREDKNSNLTITPRSGIAAKRGTEIEEERLSIKFNHDKNNQRVYIHEINDKKISDISFLSTLKTIEKKDIKKPINISPDKRIITELNKHRNLNKKQKIEIAQIINKNSIFRSNSEKKNYRLYNNLMTQNKDDSPQDKTKRHARKELMTGFIIKNERYSDRYIYIITNDNLTFVISQNQSISEYQIPKSLPGIVSSYGIEKEKIAFIMVGFNNYYIRTNESQLNPKNVIPNCTHDSLRQKFIEDNKGTLHRKAFEDITFQEKKFMGPVLWSNQNYPKVDVVFTNNENYYVTIKT